MPAGTETVWSRELLTNASLSQIVMWSREAISRTDTHPYLFPTVLLQAVEQVTSVGQPEGQHLQIFQMFLRQEKTMKAWWHTP